MIKSINQIIVFVLEIIMLVSYGYFGMTRPWGLTLQLLFTFLMIGIAVMLWSVFAAPKSVHRLEMPYLAFFRAAMFLLSAWLILQLGYKNYGIAVFVLAILTQTIGYFTKR